MSDKTPHPAKYSKELLPYLAKHSYGVCLDIMGGTGRIGLLKEINPLITKTISNELEKEWAIQGIENKVDEIIIGDAKNLKLSVDCIITSPPYGNRMADNFKPSKPSSMRKLYAGDLGRTPSNGSVCCKHFNRGYEEIIKEIYDNVIKNVQHDLFILNVSNFIRKFKEVDVISWYLNYFKENGYYLKYRYDIVTRRQRGVGANAHLRVPTEFIGVFSKNNK
jgi:hypothetical protein